MLLLLSIWIIMAGFSLVGGFILTILQVISAGGFKMMNSSAKQVFKVAENSNPTNNQQQELPEGYAILERNDSGEWHIIDHYVDYMKARECIKFLESQNRLRQYMIKRT